MIMISRRKFTATTLASIAGSMFAFAPVLAGSTSGEAEVKCYGVNKCKGHNDCKTATNACKGHASCKGQGFIKMSQQACEEIGGSVNKPAN
jgi:uncharacterized membrane protein